MQFSDILVKNALFCDETEDYRTPAEPEAGDSVVIRFRTLANNVDNVYLISRKSEIKMEKVRTEGLFDFYETQISVGSTSYLYYFEIEKGRDICYYNKLGCTTNLRQKYAFRITPGFHTPEWAKGAVFYQIYVDRFYNAEPSNDVLSGEYYYVGSQSERVTDWDSLPANLDIGRFYGGDLQGVRAKLDYLQELGVEVIYFNPLFVSPSNHKYDIQDYDYIDPHFAVIKKDDGELLKEDEKENKKASRYICRVTSKENLEASNEYFAELVKEIHARGMKVILDGVFNHCGSFNKWLDRECIYEGQKGYEPGAYVSESSPYHDFFGFTGGVWPYNKNYEGWWGHDTLPKLNYEGSKELYDYILRIGKKWVSAPYNVDGWRLDVAADLGHSIGVNHQFWKDFRKSVKKANPEAIILAEHYGDPSSWMRGDQWDTVMNYDAFMEPITWFLTGMEKHSDEMREVLRGNADHFMGAMSHHMANMLVPSLLTSMNQLSNHDHSRFLTRTNHVVGRVEHLGPEAANEFVEPAVMREAAAFQMTWIGSPTIYYGDEAGVCGFTDPDNRRTYPWGREDKEMIAFHRELIKIHKTYQAFRTGALQMLLWEEHLLAYGRFLGEEQLVVVLNNKDELTEVTVPVWKAEVPVKGRMKRLIYSGEKGYTTEYEEYLICDGELVVNMGAHSMLIAVTLKEEEIEETFPIETKET